MILGRGARLGPYVIEDVLGRGGMGAVYRARDERLSRVVALKVILPELVSDPRFLERFRREALAAAAVRHPNVTTLHESGAAGGSVYLAFELVTGGSLQDRLRRGPLPWREAAAFGAQAARGLAALHAAGIVHRDLKPANVLLDADGRALIADLGLAHAELPGVASLTRTGELVGTAEFMAPEQSDGRADERSDLYALGCTLYALLAGRPPFEGRGYEVLRRHLTELPASPRALTPEVPPELEAIVLRLLAKSPRQRGPGAGAVADELEALACRPVRERLPGAWRLVGALGALLAAALVGAAVVRSGPPAPVLPPAPRVAAPTPYVPKSPAQRPPAPAPAAPPAVDSVVPAGTSDEAPRWYRELDRRERPEIARPGRLLFGKGKGEYVNPADGSVLVWVPGGRAQIGGKEEGIVKGNPLRWVELEPYFIGKYEVTVAQYARFAAERRWPAAPGHVLDYRSTDSEQWTLLGGVDWRHPDGPDAGSPDHPVVQVRWVDALAYADWAGLDLPTDEEWERAAVWDGVTARAYPWSADPTDFIYEGKTIANVADSRFFKAFGGPHFATNDGYATTAPVGRFDNASPVGMLDALGNVWEWCYLDRRSPRGPWTHRGVGWNNRPTGIAYARQVVREDSTWGNVGFRVVLRPAR